MIYNEASTEVYIEKKDRGKKDRNYEENLQKMEK